MTKFSLPLIALSVILILALISTPLSSQTLGVGANPDSLELDAEKGGSCTDTVYVFNTGDGDADYTIYCDDEYSEWVSFDDDEFSITAGGSQGIVVTIDVPEDADDLVEFTIYVRGTLSSSGDVPVSGGVEIPVTIACSEPSATGDDDNTWIYMVALIPIAAVGVLVVLRMKSLI